MRSTSKILAAGGFIAVVIAAGVLLGWFGGRDTASVSQPAPLSPSGETAPAQTNRSRFFTRRSQPKVPATNEAPAVVSATDTNLVTNWEERIDELLRANIGEADKAKRMLALLPQFPEEGQAEAAQHIANLLPNEDYAPFGRYLADPKTPAGVLDVLIGDVLNRPNALKLPLLLEVARNPDHSKAAEARQVLELYLEADYGANWDVWQQKVEEWLKKNPD